MILGARINSWFSSEPQLPPRLQGMDSILKAAKVKGFSEEDIDRISIRHTGLIDEYVGYLVDENNATMTFIFDDEATKARWPMLNILGGNPKKDKCPTLDISKIQCMFTRPGLGILYLWGHHNHMYSISFFELMHGKQLLTSSCIDIDGDIVNQFWQMKV